MSSHRSLLGLALSVAAFWSAGSKMCMAQLSKANAAHPGNVRYLDNGSIRLGVDLDLGGAITYLAKSGTNQNLINSFDWGRQIQMSNYSGPVPFSPNGKQPRKDWAGLGWNPIQSGDCYGNRSKVTSFRLTKDRHSLVVRCIPMQWPLNNEPGECGFECDIKLDGPVVHVKSTLTNHRSDKTQWAARDQELPAIYTNGPWYRLMTYQGDAPFTNGPLSQIPAAFPWSGWSAAENWAALVDDTGFGVGVYEAGVTHFIGGFAGKPGKGGPKDGPTGYIAPLHIDILDYNIQYSFNYDLIVGDIASIRSYVYKTAGRPTPPKYRFASDRQHWRYENASDTGWPIQGELKIDVSKSNPQLISPPALWPASKGGELTIEAAFPEGIKKLRVFWTRTDSPGFSETCVMNFDVKDDNRYHVYRFDLSKSPQYKATITGIRLDPETDGLAGKYIRLREASFN